MSRWRFEWWRRRVRQRVCVGMAADGMAWQVDGSLPASTATANEVSALAQQLAPRARVDVIVADDIAVHWLQTPPAGVRSLSELRQVAAARCALLFGGQPAGWWVAGDWSATRAFVCAGLPLERVGPLQRTLAHAKAQTTWNTTVGLLLGSQAATCPADGWSAARCAGRVVAWHGREGLVTALSCLNVGAQANAAEARAAVAQWQRMEALRDPALAAGSVHWVELPPPAAVSGGAALALAPWLRGAGR